MRNRLALFLLPLLAIAAQAGPLQFKALVFADTKGFHHEAINAAVTAMERLAKLHSFDMDWTTSPTRTFTDEKLAEYQVVVFLLTTGDVLNDEQQAAFERYIQKGSGFVGIHSAADTEYDWEWYTQMLGHMFYVHPRNQTATLQVEDYNFPGMDRFAKRFLFTEEWYQFDDARHDNLNYLLTVDETTYDAKIRWGGRQTDGMGDFHPISWYHEYDGGRAFYTALGHLAATYEDPNFLHHVYGGIYWAATGRGFRAE